MSDDEKREQDEQTEVEGHLHKPLVEDTTDEDDTPDVEGHKKMTAPVRKKMTKNFKNF